MKSLTNGMDYFELAKAYWCGVSVGAKVGENYGAIRGHDFLYNDKGQVVVDAATGLPKVDQEIKTIGNSSWDWTGGFYTTFSYKNFRLSASFDVKVGASFVARNPFIVWKNIPNIDPDSSYNTSGLGLEFGSLPSRKSYGLNVNVKF